MYIATIPNRNSPPAILLRESYREGSQVKTRTLANLSKLPADAIAALQRILQGEKLVSSDDAFEIVENGSRLHGHVDAVSTAMKRLGFPHLLASRESRERDVVMAMICARVLEPQSKLATTVWWSDTTLPESLEVGDADEDELYQAMDWLLEHQSQIEKKLAKRHLESNGLALYDLTSSYFEGETCPLAAFGHNRDGKKGKLQVNYGLLTNRRGVPVAVTVFPGNTGDPKTLLPQIDKMKTSFQIDQFVLVGDRGMLTQKQIDTLRPMEGVDWIGALRPEAIKKLLKSSTVQMELFDERNLFEVVHPDFPGERLVACRNLELAQKRKEKRQKLLEATAVELDKVGRMVRYGRLYGKEAIEKATRQVLKNYRMGKHFQLEIREDGFEFKLEEKALEEEVSATCKGDAQKTQQQRAKNQLHLEAITKRLEKLQHRTRQGRLQGKDEIGVRVGKVINKYKVGKHFQRTIEDDRFEYKLDEEKIKAEAALDGIYVVRTSLPQERMDAADTVRSYKLLSHVEQAFRTFKSIDLMVRPIHHRLDSRVRAHIFLCMLAYYVQWHMMEVWSPLLYGDEDQKSKDTRDPVAPAQRSQAAMHKVHHKRLDDGSCVHSFRTLLAHLSTIVRNTCRCSKAGKEVPTFTIDTLPNPKQQVALKLLQNIKL